MLLNKLLLLNKLHCTLFFNYFVLSVCLLVEHEAFPYSKANNRPDYTQYTL